MTTTQPTAPEGPADDVLRGKQVLFISADSLLEPYIHSQGIPYMRLISDRYDVQYTLATIDTPRALAALRQQVDAMRQQLGAWGIAWESIAHTDVRAGSVVDIARGVRRLLQSGRRGSVDVVHCRGHVPAFMAGLASSLRRVPFVFDMRGAYPEEMVTERVWRPHSLQFRVAKKLERRALMRSGANVVVTHKQRDDLCRRWGPDAYRDEVMAKTSVVRNSVDTSVYGADAHRRETYRLQEQLSDRVVVLWSVGHVRPVHMPERVAAFFRFLEAVVPKAFLLVFTLEPHIRDFLLEQQLPENSFRVVTVPQAEMPFRMPSADAGVALVHPNHAGPGIKLAEYLASGVPVVTSPSGGESALVSEHGTGVVAPDLSDEGLRAAAESLAALLAEGPAVRARCRAVAERFYSLTAASEAYAACYRRALAVP